MSNSSKFIYYNSILYQTPASLNYFWGFGSAAMFFLFMQVVSGLLLSFWYIAEPSFAFNSVEYIMREVNYGWFFRYLHANGASFFFL